MLPVWAAPVVRWLEEIAAQDMTLDQIRERIADVQPDTAALAESLHRESMTAFAAGWEEAGKLALDAVAANSQANAGDIAD